MCSQQYTLICTFPKPQAFYSLVTAPAVQIRWLPTAILRGMAAILGMAYIVRPAELSHNTPRGLLAMSVHSVTYSLDNCMLELHHTQSVAWRSRGKLSRTQVQIVQLYSVVHKSFDHMCKIECFRLKSTKTLSFYASLVPIYELSRLQSSKFTGVLRCTYS